MQRLLCHASWPTWTARPACRLYSLNIHLSVVTCRVWSLHLVCKLLVGCTQNVLLTAYPLKAESDIWGASKASVHHMHTSAAST